MGLFNKVIAEPQTQLQVILKEINAFLNTNNSAINII